MNILSVAQGMSFRVRNTFSHRRLPNLRFAVLVLAIMIIASGCRTVPPPSPDVQRIVQEHRPRDSGAGSVTLKRDDFTQAELKTLDQFLESRAGKRLDQPFTSMTVSPCGGCRTPKDHQKGIWITISGMRFCIPCNEEDGRHN